MTKQMQPGPALDALVAAALGLVYRQGTPYEAWDNSPRIRAVVEVGKWRKVEPWNPSEDIASAWRVAERLVAKGWAFSIDYINGPEFYDVHIFPSDDMETWIMERAKTAPHAISLAALAALENK